MPEIKEIVFEAKVAGVFIGNILNSLETTPVEKVQVTWDGFKGDSHVGRTRLADAREDKNFFPRGCEIVNLRQWSAVSDEELQVIAQALLSGPPGKPNVYGGYLKAEWLGANLLFEGISNLSVLPPGTQLFFDRHVVLVVSEENGPCRNPGEVIQRHLPNIPNVAASFVKYAMGKRGIVGVVKRPGTIRVGSTVTVKVPKQKLWVWSLDDII